MTAASLEEWPEQSNAPALLPFDWSFLRSPEVV
jgi:hypothetical protein